MTTAAGNIEPERDPEGARNVSPEDRKRAQVFFDRGRTVFDTGNYEYAIAMYIEGLSWDPENMAAHQTTREIALTRKARGGKPMGMFAKLPKAAKTDFKRQMLNAETMLSYDPGNTDHMLSVADAAQKASFFAVVRWIGPEMFRAILGLPLPKQKAQFNQLTKLKEVFKNSREFKSASEVCELTARLRPQDLDLVQEARQLATEETIKIGKYDQGGGFTGSIRNWDEQQKLMENEKDVVGKDALSAAIIEADRAYRANPGEVALMKKLVNALRKSEQMDNENRAIELLEAKYAETRQYSFRDEVNNIKLLQLTRYERKEREALAKDPTNPELRKQYQQFVREKTEEELRIFSERVSAYPTLMEAKYEMGKRLFALARFDETIAIFQEVRNDPKYRVAASVNLGRSFLEAGFTDEAVETLAAIIADYQIKGDEKSKEMTYWYARSQELKGETQLALKSYSQVFQWDAKYRDVQARIKQLRGGGGAPGSGPVRPGINPTSGPNGMN
jgi:tetratricopeptide (TPR) repeat protein